MAGNEINSSYPTPTIYGQQPDLRVRKFTVEIDPDLYPVLEDQAHSSGMTLARYVQVTVNSALQTYLFG